MDSGAGQCLCSCSSSFSEMLPCYVELTGISGSLQIHGVGTALFLARDEGGIEILLRVYNCLFSYGDLNLISVSQFQQVQGNVVDFSLGGPSMTVFSSGVMKRPVRIPLQLDDGLFGLSVEPFQPDDPRYSSLIKCDITPRGEFAPSNDGQDSKWVQRTLAATTVSARILIAASDFGENLKVL
jgi:hypothetical protein